LIGINSFRRLPPLVKKEFIQTFRDVRMLMPIFVAPIIQLVLLGYVVTTDIKHIPVYVYDADMSARSRDYVSRIGATEHFDVKGYAAGAGQIGFLLDSGRASMIINIPRGFSKKIKRFEKAQVQLLVDGSDSNLATIALNNALQITDRYSQELMKNIIRERGAAGASAASGPPLRLPSVDLRTRVWYNPNLESSHFLVPGVICLILMLTTMLLTSLAITREREAGTLEQLIVTPVKPYELILGKLIPFIIIGYCDVILVTAIGTLVFGVPVKGSLLLLFFLTSLFLLSSLGLGLFISTVSKTQQQAMLSSFIVLLPSMLLSGFFFPIESMPVIVQLLTYFIPLRYFLVILREIFLKGNGLTELWDQALPLLVFGAAIFTASTLRFKKRI
jgi:ABC-2 type transport system permease protein